MGTLWPENLCVHRKGAIEELIKSRARDGAAQPQNLFGKPTGDHVWLELEEHLVELFTSFTDSLFSHVLMSSCEHCEVIQIPNQVRSPIGDHRSVDPGDSRKRPAAEDQRGCCKTRCTDKHDQGCQATKQVQRIQEAPHMYPTNYFDHHTCRSHSLNNPSQNPLLDVFLLSLASEPYARSITSETISTQHSETYPFSLKSETISTQDSEPDSLSFSSETISTQYTSSCPSSECGEETNTLSGDLLLLPSQRPQPMTVIFSQGMESHLEVNFGEVKAEEAIQRSGRFTAHLPKHSEAVAIQRSNKRKVVVKVSMNGQKSLFFWRFGTLNGQKSRSKALKVVVGVSGVESASLKGQDMDQIEVTGDNIDAVAIAKLLRKNIGFAEVVAVAPVEEKKPEKPKEKENEPVILPPWGWQSSGPHYVQEIYEEPASCSIM